MPPRIIRGISAQYYVLDKHGQVQPAGICAWTEWFMRNDKVLFRDENVVTVFQGLHTAVFETYGRGEPLVARTLEEAHANHKEMLTWPSSSQEPSA